VNHEADKPLKTERYMGKYGTTSTRDTGGQKIGGNRKEEEDKKQGEGGNQPHAKQDGEAKEHVQGDKAGGCE
jgi:hypothetical protein